MPFHFKWLAAADPCCYESHKKTETASQLTVPQNVVAFRRGALRLRLLSGFDSESQPYCLGDGD